MRSILEPMFKTLMKKTFPFFLLAMTVLFPASAHAGYWKNMGNDWVRGVKNIVSFPLEIPITIKEYHEGPGYPVVRHLTGLADGIFQSIERLGSGLWDILPSSIFPGIQEGFPVTPETLF